MYAYNPPPSAAPREPLPDATTQNAPSFGKALRLLGEIIDVGLECLQAVTDAPRSLVKQGENLAGQTDNAPGDRPPRRLIQAVQKWLQAIKAWIGEQSSFFKLPQRMQALEAKVDALSDDVQALEAKVGVLSHDVQTLNARMSDEFKVTRTALHKHVEHVASAMDDMKKEMRHRFDVLEDATSHDRAKVVEDALRNWALSPQAWRDTLPPAWAAAWIETEELWTDRMPSRYWPTLCQHLGLPVDSAVRSCDLLATVDIQEPVAPAPFLIVGEAAVNMDSERIRKAVQRAREVETHTDYRAMPCVCASTYTRSVLEMAQTSGVMALQWQRGDIAHVLALPDALKTFLGWP